MLSLRLKVNLEKLEPRIGHRLDLPRFTRITVQGKIGFLCSVSGSHVLHVLLPSFFLLFSFCITDTSMDTDLRNPWNVRPDF